MRYTAGLVVCVYAAGLLWAQAAGSNTASQTAPPLGETKIETPPISPVSQFRQLLAMSPEERERALAQRPESKRASLRTKITEYEAMAPEDRESRLQLAELWYYLEPLMTLAPAQRTDKLAAVPEAERPLIEERLKLWDLLRPDFQREILTNELGIQFFLRLDSSTPAQRDHWLGKTPGDWRALEEKLQHWRDLPQEERQRMYHHFEEFFEMPAKEKEKTLHVLSEDERRKLEKSLRVFEQLPPHQRAMCIESFRKFANLSKDEQNQFLKNAERWQDMTPRDRQTWINLINLLPAQSGPPLPGQTPSRPPPGTPPPGAASKPPPKLPGSK